MTARFHRREGDNIWTTAMHWLASRPGTVKLLLTAILSAGGGAAVYQWTLFDDLEAQELRMSGIEARADVTNAAVDSLERRVKAVEGDIGTLVRAECLRTSQADQALLQMQCPAHLYRGAPR